MQVAIDHQPQAHGGFFGDGGHQGGVIGEVPKWRPRGHADAPCHFSQADAFVAGLFCQQQGGVDDGLAQVAVVVSLRAGVWHGKTGGWMSM